MPTIELPEVRLHATTQDDPVEAAQWVVAFNTALREEHAAAQAARSADDDPAADQSGSGSPTNDDGVAELVGRWIDFRPGNADRLRAAVAGLRDLGYTLALSEPRTGTGNRTYVRALRPDGANAGYMNSTSFTFVGSSAIATVEPNVGDGRYPYIAWTTDNAVQTVLKVAKTFLTT